MSNSKVTLLTALRFPPKSEPDKPLYHRPCFFILFSSSKMSQILLRPLELYLCCCNMCNMTQKEIKKKTVTTQLHQWVALSHFCIHPSRLGIISHRRFSFSVNTWNLWRGRGSERGKKKRWAVAQFILHTCLQLKVFIASRRLRTWSLGKPFEFYSGKPEVGLGRGVHSISSAFEWER